jgi:hypothetical protein
MPLVGQVFNLDRGSLSRRAGFGEHHTILLKHALDDDHSPGGAIAASGLLPLLALFRLRQFSHVFLLFSFCFSRPLYP